MQERRPKVIAHRGGSDWAPENTLAAFRKSLEFGCDGIELDIQRCATGELVVFHDSDLNRTTNGVGLVSEVSYQELRRLSAGLWFDEEFRSEYVPLLSEVLDLIDGKVILNIEIKNTPIEFPGIEEDLLELLEPYGAKDKIIISSFDHGTLKRLHDLDPSYKLALLADALFVNLADYARGLGATIWHPCIDSLRSEAVAEAHASGMEVNAWTLNDARKWEFALRVGLDGIVTDDPLGLVNFLDRMAKVRS
jgi:glycerophosphoryl diester phosphodiesterase